MMAKSNDGKLPTYNKVGEDDDLTPMELMAKRAAAEAAKKQTAKEASQAVR